MTEEQEKSSREARVLIDLDDEQAVEAGIRAALYRQDCPDAVVLGEYAMGLLAEPDSGQIKAHLTHCRFCRDELQRMDEFISEPELSSRPGEESRHWLPAAGLEYIKEAGTVVIRLMESAVSQAVANLQPPLPRLALGGARRGRSSATLLEASSKEALDDFETLIFIETDWQDPDHCSITVQVDIPSLGGWPHLGDTAVSLKKDETLLSTKTTNAFGRVIFQGIATSELTRLSFEITPADK